MGAGASRQEVDKLRTSVLTVNKTVSGELMKLKLLVFGPSGMGKSSFCNGIVAAVENREHVPHVFPVGSIGGTLTGNFHAYEFANKMLIDMVGIYETGKITDENIRDVVSGKVSFYGKITRELVPQEYLPPPRGNDVSCVVLVYNMAAEIPMEIRRQLHCIMKLAGEGAISYHLVLTHVDSVDSRFKDPRKLPDVYKSEPVQRAIDRISRETGVSPAYISVVKNYNNVPSTDVFSNLLILHALDKIVTCAEDQALKADTRRSMRSSYPWAR